MLKQILKDMYVDPEILAELPEEQKQMLFFKIREEQKRRYYQHEKENTRKELRDKKKKNRAKLKNVSILEDSNGQPWTWVMGEHPNDIPLETLWSNPGIDRKKLKSSENKPVSKVQAIIFSHNKIRKDVAHITATGVTQSTHLQPNEDHSGAKPGIMLSANKERSSPQLRSSSSSEKSKSSPAQLVSSSATVPCPTSAPQAPEPNPQQMLGSKTNSDSDDDPCYENWGPGSQQQANEIEENEWKKQLKKFKEADKRRSINARRASMQMKRMSQQNLVQEKKLSDLRAKFDRRRSVKDTKGKMGRKPPALPPKPSNLRSKHPVQSSSRGSMPASREEAMQWFRDTQLSEIVDTSEGNAVPNWFHGIIPRSDAEKLLGNSKFGDFLIRVSDKIWGYALSYKDEEKIKHFLIDASEPNCYHFFGNDQIRHPGMEELVAFHKEEAISYGNEILKDEVGQLNPAAPDYSDLISTSDMQSPSSDGMEITEF